MYLISAVLRRSCFSIKIELIHSTTKNQISMFIYKIVCTYPLVDSIVFILIRGRILGA